MPALHVVVVLLFPFDFNVVSFVTSSLKTLFFLMSAFLAVVAGVKADSNPSPYYVGEQVRESAGYLARYKLNSPKELESALKRAEMLLLDGSVPQGASPVSFVVHGPEVQVFFRENYRQYSEIVDLAARLTAFKVIDIRVCETRTGILGRDKNALYPFVGTVPYGPKEVERLLGQQYIYF